MPICGRHDCGVEFAPGTRGSPKRFCSKACGNLQRMRDWNARNPERRAAHAKKWNDANGEHRMWAAIKRNYGLTREQWDGMLVAQSGRCDICRDPLAGKVDVDHDHKTGAVRSLLCHRCNVGLAYVESFGAPAQAYLEKHRE